MSIRLLWQFYRASGNNFSAAWREWRWRHALNSKSVVKTFQTLPDERRLFSFKSLSDFMPWMTSTDRDVDGTSLAEIEFSRNNTMIFRGNVGADPDGGYDPYGAAIVYCERFDPPLDLEAYDYLVWRVRELPPMDLVSQLPPDDPRLRRMQRQDTMRGSDESAAASASTFGAADEDEPAEQKYERLQYLFVNDARKSESDGASAPPTPSSTATGSSLPPPPPVSTISRSLTIMSSLLSVPLPLSHAAHPFLRPDEALYRYTPGSSIFASLAPTGVPASPTVGAGSAAVAGDLSMHTSAADPNAGDANQRVSAANPFDPNLPSNHWLYDGREVCLTVETASPDGFEQNFRRLFNSKDADASGASDPVQVHAHPALLPAPELLLRSRVENTDAAMMHAPHARSALFQREDDDAPAPTAASSSSSASASASASSASTSTSAASSTASADAAPLPSDGMRVPGRPFVNLIVPLRPERRESWPNVSSPQRPWRALLAAALPTTAQGAPIFPDQARYLEFSHNMASTEITRVGLAIPYSQPGPFAIEIESVHIVRGEVAQSVWPRFRPL